MIELPDSGAVFSDDEATKTIRIRASSTDKTYIGAEFCTSEESLRDICQGLDAQDVLDVNIIRSDVQSGISVSQAILTQESKLQNLKPALVTNTRFREGVIECLNRIAAGSCVVYPLDN